MKKLCMVYRKPVKEFFSIEKVFSIVKEGLKGRFFIEELSVPNNRITLTGLLNNLRYTSRSKADLYHVTGDIHYVTLALPGRKTILTIHDCVFMYKSQGFKKLLIKYLFLKWPVKHSRFITTISEATKSDIIRYSNCAPEKIFVIPNPLPDSIRFVQRDFKKDLPVLLFIGTTANKNLERVIPALENLQCILDIIGVIPPPVKTMLEKAGINWQNSFYLEEEQLAQKYIDADIILFPSLFEGFGLPILEAQKAGRPVITSDLQPMKDVAGGGACLVDPTDIQSIRAGIISVIENDEYRQDLVNKGFINIRRFHTDTIVEKYISVYNRVLNEN